jgi:hypothetical protein
MTGRKYISSTLSCRRRIVHAVVVGVAAAAVAVAALPVLRGGVQPQRVTPLYCNASLRLASQQKRCAACRRHCCTSSTFAIQHANASLQVARAARASARAEPSVTARSCVTTSRVSPSPPSVVSRVVVVSSVSLLVSRLYLGAVPKLY